MAAMSESRPRSIADGICVVGAQPPPVHGLAMVNAAVTERLKSRGRSPLVLNLAAYTLKRSWRDRLSRAPRVARALLTLWSETTRSRVHTVYAGLSGGWGQLYDALFVASARLTGSRIFLHHHSFAYVDQRKAAAALLMKIAGPNACHVVLCEKMERELRSRYPEVRTTRVVSNAIFSRSSPATIGRAKLRSVGFLSNISFEKGIAEVLEVAARVEHDLAVRIAGPFEDETVERYVRVALARLPNVTYVGPRYGADKDAFFEEIDVLLFPSKYVNEAAPLAVYEAMSRGIPVLAWERGCLSSMLDARWLVPRGEDYAGPTVSTLQEWLLAPAAFEQISRETLASFERQLSESISATEELLDDLCREARTLKRAVTGFMRGPQ